MDQNNQHVRAQFGPNNLLFMQHNFTKLFNSCPSAQLNIYTITSFSLNANYPYYLVSSSMQRQFQRYLCLKQLERQRLGFSIQAIPNIANNGGQIIQIRERGFWPNLDIDYVDKEYQNRFGQFNEQIIKFDQFRSLLWYKLSNSNLSQLITHNYFYPNNPNYRLLLKFKNEIITIFKYLEQARPFLYQPPSLDLLYIMQVAKANFRFWGFPQLLCSSINLICLQLNQRVDNLIEQLESDFYFGWKLIQDQIGVLIYGERKYYVFKQRYEPS